MPTSAADARQLTQTTEGERSALDARIEAVLMSVSRPVPVGAIARALGCDGVEPSTSDEPESDPRVSAEAEREVTEAIARLNAEYDRSGRSFRIEPVAGGVRMMTRQEFAPVIAAFQKSRANMRLTRAAVETLAIIAYKQPLTRGELEAIRGVACGEVLRTLLDRRLVTIKGRAEQLGRPALYGTTKQFLDVFGLATLKDLPTAEELSVTG